ncbi:MAG TPA: hypothetical protein VEV17_06365 [Bryobacteraceae bacterium]|nr:hypothetical protein [Bryobacteraceae bacterium]
MRKHFSAMLLLANLCWPAHAIEQRHGILVGEVRKVDSATKTVVVKLADGTEHTFHFVKRTAVHGAQDTAAGAQDAFHGLKEGSQVAVHYTAKGTEETAEEVDNVGKDGLKATEATVTHFDRGAKTMAVKTADGTEQTFKLTDKAARDAGQDIAQGTEKSTKVTVYYTEDAGHKVAHFFKKVI